MRDDRDNHWKFWNFSILSLWNKFSEKRKSFSTNWRIAFLVESTKIENGTFPCKTSLSEANIKTNIMGSAKWTYHKEWCFASNYFIIFKIFFSVRTSYKELIWCDNYPNDHIHTFLTRWSFIWGCLFSVSILKTNIFHFTTKSANIVVP